MLKNLEDECTKELASILANRPTPVSTKDSRWQDYSNALTKFATDKGKLEAKIAWCQIEAKRRDIRVVPDDSVLVDAVDQKGRKLKQSA